MSQHFIHVTTHHGVSLKRFAASAILFTLIVGMVPAITILLHSTPHHGWICEGVDGVVVSRKEGVRPHRPGGRKWLDNKQVSRESYETCRRIRLPHPD